MEEYQLNPFSLSKAIHLSPAGARQLVIGKTKVSVPTALRLAKLFGKTPAYWLDLQREADLNAASNDKELQVILKGISMAKKPAPSKTKISEKPGKKKAISEKRKKAAKVPGAKPAGRKR
jgi:addiction module HigA family antidote